MDPQALRVTGSLLSAQTAVSRLIQRQAVEGTGHDPTTVDLLVRLDQSRQKGLRAGELADQLLLSPSHISRSIDRAEAAGLVVRSPDPRDRRAAIVRLTDAGRTVLRDFAPRLRAILAQVVEAPLSKKEAQTLVALLGRVRDAARHTLNQH